MATCRRAFGTGPGRPDCSAGVSTGTPSALTRFANSTFRLRRQTDRGPAACGSGTFARQHCADSVSSRPRGRRSDRAERRPSRKARVAGRSRPWLTPVRGSRGFGVSAGLCVQPEVAERSGVSRQAGPHPRCPPRRPTTHAGTGAATRGTARQQPWRVDRCRATHPRWHGPRRLHRHRRIGGQHLPRP
jgi:hypothetical protein